MSNDKSQGGAGNNIYFCHTSSAKVARLQNENLVSTSPIGERKITVNKRSLPHSLSLSLPPSSSRTHKNKLLLHIQFYFTCPICFQ